MTVPILFPILFTNPVQSCCGVARGATRGDGNKYVGLGFDDFACTPTTRQNILTTIGKYLGFEPITTPAD